MTQQFELSGIYIREIKTMFMHLSMNAYSSSVGNIPKLGTTPVPFSGWMFKQLIHSHSARERNKLLMHWELYSVKGANLWRLPVVWAHLYNILGVMQLEMEDRLAAVRSSGLGAERLGGCRRVARGSPLDAFCNLLVVVGGHVQGTF